MPEAERHESQDLADYTVDSANDTLAGDPGDDPADRGVVPPGRWTAGMRYALKGEEESESHDELLSEQEPDVLDELDELDDDSWDENATDQEVGRLSRYEGAEPRAGRLVAPPEDTDDPGDTLVDAQDAEVARDAGIAGGAASAEEAAVHVIDDDEDQ